MSACGACRGPVLGRCAKCRLAVYCDKACRAVSSPLDRGVSWQHIGNDPTGDNPDTVKWDDHGFEYVLRLDPDDYTLALETSEWTERFDVDDALWIAVDDARMEQRVGRARRAFASMSDADKESNAGQTLELVVRGSGIYQGHFRARKLVWSLDKARVLKWALPDDDGAEMQITEKLSETSDLPVVEVLLSYDKIEIPKWLRIETMISPHSDRPESLSATIIRRYDTTAWALLKRMDPGPQQTRVALILVAQTLGALATIKSRFVKFFHNDLHLDNVFLDASESHEQDSVVYPDPVGLVVPSLDGFKPVVLGDFGRSLLTFTQTMGKKPAKQVTWGTDPLRLTYDADQLLYKTALIVPGFGQLVPRDETDRSTSTVAETVKLAEHILTLLRNYPAVQKTSSSLTEHAPIRADLRVGPLQFSLATTPGVDEYMAVDDRAKGLVLGKAVGDYLGARVVGAPTDYFLANQGALERLVDGDADVVIPGADWPDLLPGQVSAATETWIATAQGILNEPHNTDRGAARWIVKWANNTDQPPFSIQNELRRLIPTSLTAQSSAPERKLRTAAASSASLTSATAMVRVSALSLWNPRDSALARAGSRLEKEAAQNAALTHGARDVKHAAVAYALICQRLVYGPASQQGAASIAMARAYLQRESPGGAALRALSDAVDAAQLNRFDTDPRSTRQVFSPGDTRPAYVRALYGIVWFLQQADRSPGENLWVSAVRNAVASGGDTNITASLVGAVLGAYYGQQAVPTTLVGQTLSYDSRSIEDEKMQRPAWLRAQRLIYLAEALGRLDM